jgi:hypothetical protein
MAATLYVLELYAEKGADRRVLIYRGPGFLALILLSPAPTPLASTVSKLDRRHTGRQSQLADGRGRGGAKSYDDKKARSAINHSKLSGADSLKKGFLPKKKDKERAPTTPDILEETVKSRYQQNHRGCLAGGMWHGGGVICTVMEA